MEYFQSSVSYVVAVLFHFFLLTDRLLLHHFVTIPLLTDIWK